MGFHRFKDMDLVELIHSFDLSNIHTFVYNVSLTRLFSLNFQLCKIPNNDDMKTKNTIKNL